jgi:hypothetical protein
LAHEFLDMPSWTHQSEANDRGDLVADAQGYQGRSAALRETAKWLAAVFVGAGAILFSGLSFANLSALGDSDSFVLIVACASAPLIAAGIAVAGAARVISVSPPSVHEILPRSVQPRVQGAGILAVDAQAHTRSSEWQKNIESMRPPTVQLYQTIENFESELITAQLRLQEFRDAYAESGADINRRLDVERAEKDLGALQEGVLELIACAEFLRVKDSFDCAKIVILICAVVAVIGVGAAGILASAAASPEPEAPAKAEGAWVSLPGTGITIDAEALVHSQPANWREDAS